MLCIFFHFWFQISDRNKSVHDMKVELKLGKAEDQWEGKGSENVKTLKKETGDSGGRWTEHTHLQVRRTNIALEAVILLKQSIDSMHSPSKLQLHFPQSQENIRRLKWKPIRAMLDRELYWKYHSARGCYRAILTKTASLWSPSRNRSQWNRIANQKTNLCNSSHLIFDKDIIKNIDWNKDPL